MGESPRHLQDAAPHWQQVAPRAQVPLDGEPYDRWISPAGEVMAEFHRGGPRYVVRFPGQADFTLEPASDGGFAITARPVPGLPESALRTLYSNSIAPIIGNHRGGLFLHGSAVSLAIRPQGSAAIAFLGLSRSGKTTLAGAFAARGHPFLTEDVIDLDRRGGHYLVRPKPTPLRLFADSAAHLLGEQVPIEDAGPKRAVETGERLPFARDPARLRAIFVLGTDHAAPLSIRRYSPHEALGALMPHAFILDVEDRERLAAHFARMADLTQGVPCHALDYRREYEELPALIEAILASVEASKADGSDGTGG